jgi:hypothetical protein
VLDRFVDVGVGMGFLPIPVEFVRVLMMCVVGMGVFMGQG